MISGLTEKQSEIKSQETKISKDKEKQEKKEALDPVLAKLDLKTPEISLSKYR